MNERYDDKIHVPDMASNSTGRLAASQPGEPLQPRCPKCGCYVQLELLYPEAKGIVATCAKGCRFPLMNGLADCAQFFRPSSASPLPTYEQAKPNMGYAWPGFSFDGKEHEIRYVYDRMRDAMQKCLGVANSGSAGQRYTESESTIALVNWRSGMIEAAQLIESVCQGTDCEHSKKYAELIRKRVAKTKSEPSGSAGQEPLNVEDYRNAPSGIGPQADEWKNKPHRLIYDLINEIKRLREPEGRAESAAEPRCAAIVNDQGFVPDTCGLPLGHSGEHKYIEPPVVSASPAWNGYGGSLSFKSWLEMHTHLFSYQINQVVDAHKAFAAAQPVAAPDNRMRCTECKEPVCDHLAAKLIPWLESYVQPVAANPPRDTVVYDCGHSIEKEQNEHLGQTRWICNAKCPACKALANPPKVEEPTTQEIGDIVTQVIGSWPLEVIRPSRPTITRIVKLCRPFFTQVSQPHDAEAELLGQRIETFYGSEKSDKLFPRHDPRCDVYLQKDCSCGLNRKALSPNEAASLIRSFAVHKYGDPATRQWSDDLVIEFVQWIKGLTPVSGNGTEPPEGLQEPIEFSDKRCTRCGAKRLTSGVCSLVAGDNGKGGCPDPTYDYYAEKIALAGAASHNGQGWVRVGKGGRSVARND